MYGVKENLELKIVSKIIYNTFSEYSCELNTILLFGGKENRAINLKGPYELYVFTKDNISLGKHMQISSKIKIDCIKNNYINVKCTILSQKVFKEIVDNDKIIGTYFHIICKNSILIYDNKSMLEDILSMFSEKEDQCEENFIKKCVEFSTYLGSERWINMWNRKLLQHKYINGRGESI